MVDIPSMSFTISKLGMVSSKEYDCEESVCWTTSMRDDHSVPFVFISARSPNEGKHKMPLLVPRLFLRNACCRLSWISTSPIGAPATFFRGILWTMRHELRATPIGCQQPHPTFHHACPLGRAIPPRIFTGASKELGPMFFEYSNRNDVKMREKYP